MNNTVLQDGQFSITKEQLRELTDPKIKEWFPEVFEVKLEVGKWMKTPNGGFYCPKEKLKNGFGCYGFSPVTKTWLEKKVSKKEAINDIEATEQEVFEALKNEAVKRGFVEGAFVKTARGTIKQILGDYHFDGELATFSGDDGYMSSIFLNGNWATIIPKITKSEAEKLLNKKIID